MRHLPYVITCSKCGRPRFFQEYNDSAKCYWCGTSLSEPLHKEITVANFLDLAEVESRACRWKEADRWYTKALEIDPNNVDALTGRAASIMMMKDLAETAHGIDLCRLAGVCLERALDAGVGPYRCGYIFVHLAYPYAEAGDFETAKSLVERGVRLEPPIEGHVNHNVWPDLGDIAASQRKYDVACSLHRRSEPGWVSI